MRFDGRQKNEKKDTESKGIRAENRAMKVYEYGKKLYGTKEEVEKAIKEDGYEKMEKGRKDGGG